MIFRHILIKFQTRTRNLLCSDFRRLEYCKKSTPLNASGRIDLSQYPENLIRNFSIIAHVDHGKSTLADRLMEFTGAIDSNKKNSQVLDRLQVEKERGITVKAQSVALFHEWNGQEYLLNFIDTPGHVDFCHEVARSLAACESVILLVDANEGVQAQTVANFYLSFGKNLTIIPVINKIDLPGANPQRTKEQLKSLFDIEPSSVLEISAKLGKNIDQVLEAVISRSPSPADGRAKNEAPITATQGLVLDCWYESYKGVVVQMILRNGKISVGDKIFSRNSRKEYSIKEISIFTPDPTPVKHLYAGQVGYILPGMRSKDEIHIGDTLCDSAGLNLPALTGIEPAKPMVFAGVFPECADEYDNIKSALDKLLLNDSSVFYQPSNNSAIGSGWRLGFLGLLHMDVFRQRLLSEYNIPVILTPPTVPYRVQIHGAKNIKFYGSEWLTLNDMLCMPPVNIIVGYEEFKVTSTIIAPLKFMHQIERICYSRRGEMKELFEIGGERFLARCILPLSEIIMDFNDQLKSMTSGYASFDYEDLGWFPADLEKLDVLLNGEIVEEMTTLCHTSRASDKAREMATLLAKEIPRQQYLIKIQVAIGKRILAKEQIKPYRKDVTAKLYGRDFTRKQKLLKRQAEGKKLMRAIGEIHIPREVFVNVFKNMKK